MGNAPPRVSSIVATPPDDQALACNVLAVNTVFEDSMSVGSSRSSCNTGQQSLPSKSGGCPSGAPP